MPTHYIITFADTNAYSDKEIIFRYGYVENIAEKIAERT